MIFMFTTKINNLNKTNNKYKIKRIINNKIKIVLLIKIKMNRIRSKYQRKKLSL